MTLPDEGPEQRWRRTVRKRPAKLKLGRLLRDFGYAELDAEVAEAIESRMASVGLGIRPSLRVAAADEIVTVYRDEAATGEEARPAATGPAVAAAPDPPQAKPRRAAPAPAPAAAKAIADLETQLADARTESERLRSELDGQIAASADADRAARGQIVEQTTLIELQARQLTELTGLLTETRAALAEARDEIRMAVGDLPAAVVDTPVDDAGLTDEEGWLTDAAEPPPPSPVEAVVSAIADEPDAVLDVAEPPQDEIAPVVSTPFEDATAADEVMLESETGVEPGEDVVEAREQAALADDLFAVDDDIAPLDGEYGLAAEADPPAAAFDAEAPPQDGVAVNDAALPPADGVWTDDVTIAFEPVPEHDPETPLASEPAADDIVAAEDHASAQDDVFSFHPDPDPDAAGESSSLAFDPPPSGIDATKAAPDEPEPPRRDAAADHDDLAFPAAPQSAHAEVGADTTEWAVDDEADPAAGAAEPVPVWPDSDAGTAIAAGSDDPPLDDGEDLFGGPDEPPPSELESLFDDPQEATALSFEDTLPPPDPAEWSEEGPGALPPPPPLPPSPFAGEFEPPPSPTAPIEPSSSRPARRGRMARGRGRWNGTCSVCERFPEVTRRKDLEAAGWQLDGDFPTCPQCRGLS